MTLCLPHPLAAAARRAPHRLAIQGPTGELTYAELVAAVASRAQELAAVGVGPGSRVALMGSPSARWVVELWAIGWRQAIAVVLDPDLPAAELSGRSERADHVVSVEDGSALPPLGLVAPSLATVPTWDLDTTQVVVYSSGSAGEAAPVELTTRQLAFAAFGSALQLGHHLDDIWLLCLPVHHVAGLMTLFRTAWNATSAWVEPSFDTERVARLLRDGVVTQASLVPTQLRDILNVLSGAGLSARVRFLLVGGAPCPPDLYDKAQSLGVPICLTWGMSETAAQVATASPFAPAPPETPLPPLATLSVTANSEILEVHGPHARDGSLQTADRGVVGEDGCVSVIGRRDRAILSGGETIDPTRSEIVIASHSDVADVAVLSWPHVRWGETQVAFVAPRGSVLEPNAVLGLCRRLLEPFHIPRHWAVVRRIPRSAAGKIGPAERRLLRGLLEARLSEGGDEALGDGSGPPALEVDAGVYVLDASVHLATSTLHFEEEGQAGGAAGGELEDDG